ncbi:MAG: rhomboid family intramembrane serine protease [Bacteroidales bacterium]
MTDEKRQFIQSLQIPLLWLILMWVIFLGEQLTGISVSFLGIYPQKAEGLPGILFSPLIHGDWAHLTANSIPVIVLGPLLFYIYKGVAYRTFFLIWLLTGIAVWLGARPSYHIGASGVIYGLASFLFFSGLFRKDMRLLAITLFVTFLYGSMVWGVFPDFFPEKNISWESHFWGGVNGLILAWYYRYQGPRRKKYDWELEEEEEEYRDEETETIATGNNTESRQEPGRIEIIYSRPDNLREEKNPENKSKSKPG